MINTGFDNDLISGEAQKPLKRVKDLLKKNGNARDKVLTPEQFNRLMDKLPRHTKAILATAFCTGMRKGEILKLTWNKVDLKARTIQPEIKDTKDREKRTAPIWDDLHGILSNIPRAIHGNHVFLYKGKPIKNDIRTGLKKGCKDAGIPYGRKVKNGFTFHDLRHTFNTYMRKAGVHDSVIMEKTGHSTREMFDRYNTIDSEDARKAVDQFQGYLSSVDQTVDQVVNNEE